MFRFVQRSTASDMRVLAVRHQPACQRTAERVEEAPIRLTSAMPAETATHENGLPQCRHRCASDLILVAGEIFSLEEDVEAFGQRVRHGRTQYEVTTQRKQVLVIVELVSCRASLHGNKEPLGSGPRSLKHKFVPGHERYPVPDERWIVRIA